MREVAAAAAAAASKLAGSLERGQEKGLGIKKTEGKFKKY